MGYIGNQTSNSYTSLDKQTITGDGGASYTLDHAVANENEIEVFVNNVRQEPSVAYTVSGTALTMTGNVESSDDFYVVFQGKAIQTVVPPSDSVTTDMINDDSVTSAKIADNDFMVDLWYLTANSTALSGNTTIGSDASTTVSQMTTYGYIGSSRMTASSGKFTFPKNGTYEVIAHAQIIGDGADNNLDLRIEWSTNDGSSWTQVTTDRVFQDGSNDYSTIVGQFIFNVTDTANQKVQFVVASADGTTIAGGTPFTKTYFIFKRLGEHH